MGDPRTQIIQLHDQVIEQYNSTDHSDQAYKQFIDTLKQYATAITLATTHATCSLLGLDVDSVRLLDLTDDQYRRLMESGMMDTYLEGKDEPDD